MTSDSLPRSLLSEKARNILVILTDGYRCLPDGGSQSVPLFPDVQISSQHFIDMGLRPATAERLLECFLKRVSQIRQTFEFYSGRAVQGGCPLPHSYYHDTFIVLYRRTIQRWASQIASAAWLCRTGVCSLNLRRQCINIYVDNVTKNDTLPRVGFQPTLFTSSKLEEVCEKDDTLLTKLVDPNLTLSSPSAISPISTFASSGDLFSGVTPSTCFPARYPPLGELHTLSRRAFVTSFTRAASTVEKSSASCGADVLPLISLFSQMSVSGLEVGTTIQRSSKGFPRNSKPKKIEPLPPLLSSVIVDASGYLLRNPANDNGFSFNCKVHTCKT
ncbi:hypothetical protein F5148DRAFT_851436 [Russula earlei]|uniref:Uncharacterized protein n=1 Tax=Russula earlei TaxID=71964 RepID=A0ACC0UN50_9AGAM|nr:hypothetical protein F5148DRAFT_851436 [Russula earlei]